MCNCLSVSYCMCESEPCGLSTTPHWWEDTCAIRRHTESHCIIITLIQTLSAFILMIHYPSVKVIYLFFSFWPFTCVTSRSSLLSVVSLTPLLSSESPPKEREEKGREEEEKRRHRRWAKKAGKEGKKRERDAEKRRNPLEKRITKAKKETAEKNAGRKRAQESERREEQKVGEKRKRKKPLSAPRRQKRRAFSPITFFLSSFAPSSHSAPASPDLVLSLLSVSSSPSSPSSPRLSLLSLLATVRVLFLSSHRYCSSPLQCFSRLSSPLLSSPPLLASPLSSPLLSSPLLSSPLHCSRLVSHHLFLLIVPYRSSFLCVVPYFILFCFSASLAGIKKRPVWLAHNVFLPFIFCHYGDSSSFFLPRSLSLMVQELLMARVASIGF